jgi:hypothetical protein
MLSDQQYHAVKADLEEARRWGDIGEIARLSEEIREWEDYQAHCEELRWEWERGDI